ncbi:MAG: 2-oxo acid dehydrogenase subunit E2 [Hyphomonadaceae bacterium]|nr:2-oxo acid dehydrogenase subunit E2 [Hyphomonadaceae bacterium]MBC6412038.1 2-oxo acid dehydrogenase subunit E2 [Hyphomonadaceae bacterium]
MSGQIQAFTMPKWGIEMREGVIRQWHADIGDQVSEGDVLVVIETEKIANDVELEYDGTLRYRVGGEGDTFPVGALIAVFADPSVSDQEVARFVENFKSANAGFADSRPDGAPQYAHPATQAVIPGNPGISPLAGKLARELGIDPASVQGSGRRGRISLQDVEQAARAQGLYRRDNNPAAENPCKVIRLSPMRKTIAERLTVAGRDIPHFYLRSEIGMDALMQFRQNRRQGSINDYIIKACAVALRAEPGMNVHFTGDSIHQFERADISVAVATGRGLLTPVIRAADTKSVSDISAEMKALIQKAKDEKLQPAEYRGGTFSLSNLGMMGITGFDAIINPPMGAILAVGAIRNKALPGGGEAHVMNVTLSCDHRAIDGALGAGWLTALGHALEHPENL